MSCPLCLLVKERIARLSRVRALRRRRPSLRRGWKIWVNLLRSDATFPEHLANVDSTPHESISPLDAISVLAGRPQCWPFLLGGKCFKPRNIWVADKGQLDLVAITSVVLPIGWERMEHPMWLDLAGGSEDHRPTYPGSSKSQCEVD